MTPAPVECSGEDGRASWTLRQDIPTREQLPGDARREPGEVATGVGTTSSNTPFVVLVRSRARTRPQNGCVSA